MRGSRWLLLLALAPTPAVGEPRFSEPRAVAGPALDGELLDLAFVADDRVLALSARALSLCRLEDGRLERLAARPLPEPLRPVRSPGGRLLPDPAGGSAWVLTSQLPRALLFGVDRELSLRGEAEALPWPGAPGGLRYRPGTNLLEGTLGRLGDGPFLALTAGPPALALGADGSVIGAERAPAVGPPLDAPWPDLVLAAGPRPPEGPDELVALDAARGLAVLARQGLPGPVRALASRAGAREARLLVAFAAEVGLRFAELRLVRAP